VDPTNTLPTGTRSLLWGCRLHVHMCRCQPGLHAKDGCDLRPMALENPLLRSRSWEGSPWAINGPGRLLGDPTGSGEGVGQAAEMLLGSGSAVNMVKSDDTAGFAILSASPLFQRRAGSGTVPCLWWDRAGSPALHPAVAAQAAKKTQISSKPSPIDTHTHIYLYVRVRVSTWDTGRAGTVSPALAVQHRRGLVDVTDGAHDVLVRER